MVQPHVEVTIRRKKNKKTSTSTTTTIPATTPITNERFQCSSSLISKKPTDNFLTNLKYNNIESNEIRSRSIDKSSVISSAASSSTTIPSKSISRSSTPFSLYGGLGNDEETNSECNEKLNIKRNNEMTKSICDSRNKYDNENIKNSYHVMTDANGNEKSFIINIELDFISLLLFAVALCTRIYKLSSPNNIVFDELHYGKYVSLYMKNIFFFDQHPPLGKQLIAGIAQLIGYNGNFTFSRIGAQYTSNVPIFWLRLIPAICGSLLSPLVYKLLLEVKLSRWTALIGGILIILDNALLTQSRFILMESMLILFSLTGIYFLLKFQKSKFISIQWISYGILTAMFLTLSISVKYVGFYTCILAFLMMCKFLWDLLLDKTISNFQIFLQTFGRFLIFTVIPVIIYMTIFYYHLKILYKAGPHDSVMTSAFQASLDGGLASITRGQPLKVVHGSQITLRHTHGRMCWLHSHAHVYPVRYLDKRGSSHQQQVTCYSFKDVNNWWIVKRPEKDDLVVGDEPDPIKHGDIVQLVHGITSRALNTHDVAAPMTPSSQEVSCYIDYNVSMPGQLLWKVHIINKDTEGEYWHAIRSQIRLIHVDTGYALRFSGRQLPDWGFNQHEIVADKIIEQQDTIWNVEEHRYTKTEDQRERERQMINAEMIPTSRTVLSFWDKFIELQSKMLWYTENLQSHMYSSEPIEWPLLDKGIAYWVDKNSNAQIHLLGNIFIWYSASFSIIIYCSLLVFYLMRRRRLYYDIPFEEWIKFQLAGELFLGGYLIHYLPYYFVDRTLFLHNYLPALIFKILLLCFIIEHINLLLKILFKNHLILIFYHTIIFIWLICVFYVYKRFLALSYGTEKLSAIDLINLRWKDTWDFILHRDLN